MIFQWFSDGERRPARARRKPAGEDQAPAPQRRIPDAELEAPPPLAVRRQRDFGEILESVVSFGRWPKTRAEAEPRDHD